MMKRYMVILVLFVMFLSVSHAVNAQDSKEIITKQITVSFPTYERAGTYTGEALNGIPNGNGTFTSANDDEIQWTYTGQWADGAFNGEGSTIWDDGWQTRGVYRQNVLVSGQTLDNGAVLYDGSFAWHGEEGIELYDGEGKLYNMLGRLIWTGQFSMGCLVESEEARLQRSKELAPLCTWLSDTDYERIIQNESDWIGRMVRLEGNVTYMWDEDWFGYGEFEVLLNHSDKRPLDVYYRYGVDEKRAVLDQNITVLGTITGVYRYDDGTGHPYTAPLVEAEIILH